MIRIAPALFAFLPATSASAEVETYAIDPVHSRIAFRVSHAGFSDAIGTFSGITGTLGLDEDDWSRSRVEATVPIASLDLGDDDWRERILDPTFFGAKRHPEARFVSTSVENAGEGRLRVGGTLSLHGVEVPIVLDVEINRIARHPLTLRRTAGFSASVTLSRAAFEMKKWKNLVGDAVEVSIEVEAQRDRTPNEETD